MKTLSDFDLTMDEVKEYENLKTRVYGERTSPVKAFFVELDMDNPDHKRLNELSGKMVKLNAYLLTQRHLL